VQRWITPGIGVAVVALAVWIVVRNFSPPQAVGKDPSSTASGASSDDGGGLLFALGDAGAASGDDGGPLLVSDWIEREPHGDGGAGMTMLDGMPVPPLPMNAPRQVRFGVVLVSYAGAQQVVGARPISRSRADARAIADRLTTTAQQDFHAAVQEGDSGSTDDLGQVKAGILEPAPEYVLFTLPVNGIGGPVDTPRGFWIVKRLE
jgi:hypothetical protein